MTVEVELGGMEGVVWDMGEHAPCSAGFSGISAVDANHRRQVGALFLVRLFPYCLRNAGMAIWTGAVQIRNRCDSMAAATTTPWQSNPHQHWQCPVLPHPRH